ncbi:hypothetical protein TPHA_0O00160 [Tetrapisispora phaffii CBS 4417]|uniref:Alpha-factor-transporting ATPase n=1 Tax=Tetrapisispora phaffii (strain ATCC 24235 / CBS 4417 / NBRC 1672 / NRRL Y-8282 / UCD 70-5) TaxID=1071381 RepID=G8C1G0_TETPH|nr:hypothetical protein TPHA_0O00160 [Tetrapisispora phaffii CBS 4417]CCE65988.1 hypothetical protein TPHA_0O00160 [Tetrapisispora phaffii CBS 4417]
MKFEHLYMYVSLRKDFLLLAFLALSTIANGLVPAITSILTGRVFELLSKFTKAEEYGIGYLQHQLTLKSMAILALGAAGIPSMWMSISSWMALGERQGFRVRSKLLEEYLEKPMEWYDLKENLAGDFTQLNRCMEELRSGSAEASAVTYQNCVAIIALICVSFYYSWQLTLIILCTSPFIIVCAACFSRFIQKYASFENKETAAAADLLMWTMDSSQTVKLSCTQSKEIKKFETLVSKCNDYFIRTSLFTAANIGILRFLTLSMFVQGFWFGSTMIRKGKLNISDVITCFYSCLMLGSILNTTLHHVIFIQKGQVALAKIQKFINESPELPSKTLTSSGLVYSHVDISIDNLTFAYPSRPTENVLKNVSLKIKSARTTFIVGKSGSGKSTITNLIMKFYEDYKGNIIVGDKDIRSVPIDELLQNITLVEQRCTLFNDTLKNNILLGSKYTSQTINDGLLSSICSLACLDSVISSLPDGIETRLGTDGITLSGGQQQRVALARAFLRDTDILILDEAVSALDIMQREILMRNISKVRQNKTTIILTHDLNQINDNDYIYLFENNEIKENGFKKTLMNDENTLFYNMYNLQRNAAITDSRASSPTIYDKDEVYEKKDDFVISPISGETFDVMKYYSEESSDDTESILSSKNTDTESSNPNSKVPIKYIIKRMVRTCKMKPTLFMGLFCAVVAGVTNPLFSWGFSYLLNGILPSSSGIGSSYYLLKWSLIVLAIALADGTFNFIKIFILGYCSEYWIMDLRNELMQCVSQKRFEWYGRSSNKSSEISALALNDLRDLRTLVTEFLSTMSTFVTVSMMGLIWAIATGWKLSLVCISMFPLIIIFSMIYGTVLQNYETSYKSAVADLENLQYEMITSIKTIKCLRLNDHFLGLYSELEKKMKRIAKKRTIVTGLGLSMLTTITTCIQSILYYYGLKLVLTGEYTSKTMFQTFTLVLFTVTTCNSLVSQIPDVSRGQRAASWVLRIIDENEYTKEVNGEDCRVETIEHENDSDPLIEIENLNFHYPNTPGVNVYQDLNLKINSGETIGLVGQSGSGKSTLMYLLTKLYDVQDNRILINGTDINDWSYDILRAEICVVEQKPNLFHGTIRENITYGVSEKNPVSETEVQELLQLVDMHEFVEALPKALDTVVDIGLLSGGQAQRLCIVRTLLRKPKVLILDECTSSLDAQTTQIVIALIKDLNTKLGWDILTIVITHNRQMMQCCSRLVVLDVGRVVEDGQFDDLHQPGRILHSILSSGE